MRALVRAFHPECNIFAKNRYVGTYAFMRSACHKHVIFVAMHIANVGETTKIRSSWNISWYSASEKQRLVPTSKYKKSSLALVSGRLSGLIVAGIGKLLTSDDPKNNFRIKYEFKHRKGAGLEKRGTEVTGPPGPNKCQCLEGTWGGTRYIVKLGPFREIVRQIR